METIIAWIIIWIIFLWVFVWLWFWVYKTYKLVFHNKKIKGRESYKDSALSRIIGYGALIIFFLWWFISLIYEVIIPLYKSINWDIIITRIIGILYLIFKIIKRPLYVAGWLSIIYSLVRFIKRSWNHDKQ